MTQPKLPNFKKVYADLVTRALYDELSHGQWEKRADVTKRVARKVPKGQAFRRALGTGDPTGLTEAQKQKMVASGAVEFANNRIYIQTRSLGNMNVDTKKVDKVVWVRLRPDVLAGWEQFKRYRST